jgi:hypothetical protein
MAAEAGARTPAVEAVVIDNTVERTDRSMGGPQRPPFFLCPTADLRVTGEHHPSFQQLIIQV